MVVRDKDVAFLGVQVRYGADMIAWWFKKTYLFTESKNNYLAKITNKLYSVYNHSKNIVYKKLFIN